MLFFKTSVHHHLWLGTPLQPPRTYSDSQSPPPSFCDCTRVSLPAVPAASHIHKYLPSLSQTTETLLFPRDGHCRLLYTLGIQSPPPFPTSPPPPTQGAFHSTGYRHGKGKEQEKKYHFTYSPPPPPITFLRPPPHPHPPVLVTPILPSQPVFPPHPSSQLPESSRLQKHTSPASSPPSLSLPFSPPRVPPLSSGLLLQRLSRSVALFLPTSHTAISSD